MSLPVVSVVSGSGATLQADADSGEPRSGTLIAQKYLLKTRLGHGGMGTVWEAEHVVSGRLVALKLLHAHVCVGRVARERFLNEARAASKIDHPAVVEVLDAGDAEGGRFFIAMERLQGESLGERVARKPLATHEILALMDNVLAPLERAHQRGILHRDLKPDNIFLLSGAAPMSVKLLDFGLVRDTAENGPTQTGFTFGTPEYMAPEQALNAKHTTPASDVWSLGAILYELLSGKKPFTGDTANEVMVAAIKEPHVPLAERTPFLPDVLTDLVDRCLSKKAQLRPTDAGALRTLLRAIELPVEEPMPRITSAGELDAATPILTASKATPDQQPTGAAAVTPAVLESTATTQNIPRSGRRRGALSALGLVIALGVIGYFAFLGPVEPNMINASQRSTSALRPHVAPAAVIPMNTPPVQAATASPTVAADRPAASSAGAANHASADEGARAAARPHLSARSHVDSPSASDEAAMESARACLARANRPCALDALAGARSATARRMRREILLAMGRVPGPND